jgi:hypothetical protein
MQKHWFEQLLNDAGWYTLNGHAEYCGTPHPQFPATNSGERRADEGARAAKCEEVECAQ